MSVCCNLSPRFIAYSPHPTPTYNMMAASYITTGLCTAPHASISGNYARSAAVPAAPTCRRCSRVQHVKHVVKASWQLCGAAGMRRVLEWEHVIERAGVRLTGHTSLGVRVMSGIQVVIIHSLHLALLARSHANAAVSGSRSLAALHPDPDPASQPAPQPRPHR
jgi:hypothetical protein